MSSDSSKFPTVILTHERTQLTQPTLDRIGHVMWIQWFDVYDHVNMLLGNEVYCYLPVEMQFFPSLQPKNTFHHVTMPTSTFHVKHGLPILTEGHSFNNLAFCVETPSKCVRGYKHVNSKCSIFCNISYPPTRLHGITNQKTKSEHSKLCELETHLTDSESGR
jgi:hypothetical protein